ncbi:putative efflux pump membrane fusion protein [Anatilimnocola aggregata]|uniref:Putative efflux pump membrane fusion protein n=1 Tax=Anatilimnocola aggregata TaxID=2528021 RepID=A0A517YLQ8_9BACT|nr:HlyD family efflux transporter periplasmic adaptor subunit [Anatilimnocola aggregata]QDU31167.1 putative efflux pump membrane fusion protein [Anatilimnocola aggregata]
MPITNSFFRYAIVAAGLSGATALALYAAPPNRPLLSLPGQVPALGNPLGVAPSESPVAGNVPAPIRSTFGITPSQSVNGQVQISHCLVSLIEDVQVPAKEAGALVNVAVTEGDYVRVGQVLAQIDDRQSQLQKMAAIQDRDAALAKANDDIEVRFAEASFEVTTAELDRALGIEKRNSGAVTAADIQKLRLAKKRDELGIDRSKLEMKIAHMGAEVKQAAVDAADEGIARRKIISPIDGLVIGLFHEKGEWVNIGEPVLQIVRVDRLRVEGFLSASEVGPESIAGKPVNVEVTLAQGRTAQLAGTVTFISPLVQAGNKYRVRAEVQNRSEQGHPVLRPGMTATMFIATH